MIPLQFGQRANQKNFPPNAKEWDLQQVFSVEKTAIDEHLCTQAQRNWLLFKDAYRALEPMRHLDHTLDIYLKHGTMPQHFAEADNGNLELAAPTKGKIRTMSILVGLAWLAEFTVMLMQVFTSGFRDFNWFILVIAFMLGLGGFVQGHGIGDLLFKRWLEHTGRPMEHDRPFIYWSVVLGTLLILLIALLRGSTAYDPFTMFLVFSITLLFGEVVSLFEALRKQYKEKRDRLLTEMLQAQRWHASRRHTEHLDSNGYLESYMTTLAQVSNKPISDLNACMAKLSKQSGAQTSASDNPEVLPPAPDALPHNVSPFRGDPR